MIVVDHHHHPPPHYQRHNHDHQHAPVGPDMPILDQSDRLVPQSLRSLPCSLCFLGFRVLKVLNLREAIVQKIPGQCHFRILTQRVTFET